MRMLLPPTLLLHYPCCERALAESLNALICCTRTYFRTYTVMSSNSSSQGFAFATHAMPSALWARHRSTALQAANGGVRDESYQFMLHQRRMSSQGTSSSSSSSKATASRHLPFASITGDQAGQPIGQLRWLSSSSSSNDPKQPTERQLQQTKQRLQEEKQKQKQLDQEALLAAAKAATAPDTFKRGDALAGGRYVLQYKLGAGPIGLAEGLGEGRFTTLWVSKDLASGQQVVLKLMEPGDAVSYTAGTREAALHAMAGRHAHIVPLLDAFEHRTAAGRHACMVLERQGSPLDYAFATWRSQHIREVFDNEQGKLYGESFTGSPEGMTALRSTARQLLQALDHLHTRGLAHMDLSMDNVLLDKPFLTEVESVAASGFGNLLQTAWHAVLDKLGSKSSQEKLQQQLSEASRDSSSYYTRSSLPNLCLKLTDFGRAVPFKQLAAQQDALDVETPSMQPPWGRTVNFTSSGDGEVGSRGALAYNPDGVVVMADPTLRPPEEILGMPYAAPAYDIWRLGCLMAELAVGVPLFTIEGWAQLRGIFPGLKQYSDDAMHLMEMQSQLGVLPREFVRKSPIFSELFFPTDIMRVAKVYDLPPRSVSITKMIAEMAHEGADKSEVNELQNFVTSMLAYDPAKRPSAAELLQHKFLQQEEPQAAAAAAAAAQQQPQQQQQQAKR